MMKSTFYVVSAKLKNEIMKSVLNLFQKQFLTKKKKGLCQCSNFGGASTHGKLNRTNVLNTKGKIFKKMNILFIVHLSFLILFEQILYLSNYQIKFQRLLKDISHSQ